MNAIDKLVEHFRRFPGIGPRQANRFVYHLLGQNHASRDDLARLITELKSEAQMCGVCGQFFTKKQPNISKCNICNDVNRDNTVLMVVEKDADLQSIEKGGIYNGYYFILGGIVPILEKNPENKIRIRELEKRIANTSTLSEIILALSATTEGDNTTTYLRETLTPVAKKSDLKISILGRGLSTGSELEYSDPDTISNALRNRS
jgi:recombination protein RecR